MVMGMQVVASALYRQMTDLTVMVIAAFSRLDFCGVACDDQNHYPRYRPRYYCGNGPSALMTGMI
jgi:hypothetical protein